MNKVQTSGFSARARVVDLLGREQIADAPTAISELLKNAIDAQAESAEVNYLSASKCLLVEDNGLGMRKSDLLQKWLVLATESKKNYTLNDPDNDPYTDPYYEFASVEQKEKAKNNLPLGNKGIGRLAVAALGRGVLVWTRWGKDEKAERTLLFVHWHLFRHLSLNLADIIVPYVELADRAPTQDDVLNLINELQNRLLEQADLWKSNEEKELFLEMQEDLDLVFKVGIKAIDSFNQTAGTLFAIVGTSSELDEIYSFPKSAEDPIKISDSLKLLFGFSNRFIDDKPRFDPVLKKDNKTIAEIKFWKLEDYENADHEINVTIDEKGFITGNIRRFKETYKYQYQTTKPLPPRYHYPGSMKLHIGYVEGMKENSHLTPELFAEYTLRLTKFGALYVYRDDIRVLPYGNTEHDFLDFEYRRSKNAGRYFFSHRRMFGYLSISAKDNEKLVDKASREGFIRNAAYRGMTFILNDLFKDLANTYFGSKAARKDKAKAKKEKDKKKAEKAKERVKKEKEEFLRNLKLWQKLLANFEKKIDAVFKSVAKRINNLKELNLLIPEQEMRETLEMLTNCRKTIDNFLNDLGSDFPLTTALNEKEQLDFDQYLTDREQFEINCNRKYDKLTLDYDKAVKEHESEKEKVKRIENEISETKTQLTDELNKKWEDFQSQSQKMVDTDSKKMLQEQVEILDETFSNIVGTDNAEEIALDESGQKAISMQATINQQKKRIREEFLPFWDRAVQQVQGVETTESGEIALGNINRELEDCRNENETLAGLSQLGFIVESLDHEFNRLFSGIRDDFKVLKKENSDLFENGSVLKHLEQSFTALEMKLAFFSPLYREEMRKDEDLSGNEMIDFINHLYNKEIHDHNIDIIFSQEFQSKIIKKVNKPVILAAIANIVHNSFYWIKKAKLTLKIKFTVVHNGFVISDTGPGIAPRDRERIFEPFFSRKPYGRGLGLYITKANFERNDLDIYVAAEPCKDALSGANFVIKKREVEEE